MTATNDLLRKVLAALAPTPLFKVAGGEAVRVTPLGEGEHHRIYRIDVGDRIYSLRLPHPQSRRPYDHTVEADAMRQAARAGVGPMVRAILPEARTILTDFIVGRPLADRDVGNPAVLPRVAALMRRLHDGPPMRGAYRAHELFWRYDQRMRERKARVPGDFAQLFALARDMLAALDAHPIALRPCHNDPVAGNFIDDGRRLWMIDWEFGGMNDPFFDLATLSVQTRFDADHDRALLAAWAGEVTGPDEARLDIYRYLVRFLWLQFNVAEFALDPAKTAFGDAARLWLDACRTMAVAGVERRIGALRAT